MSSTQQMLIENYNKMVGLFKGMNINLESIIYEDLEVLQKDQEIISQTRKEIHSLFNQVGDIYRKSINTDLQLRLEQETKLSEIDPTLKFNVFKSDLCIAIDIAKKNIDKEREDFCYPYQHQSYTRNFKVEFDYDDQNNLIVNQKDSIGRFNVPMLSEDTPKMMETLMNIFGRLYKVKWIDYMKYIEKCIEIYNKISDIATTKINTLQTLVDQTLEQKEFQQSVNDHMMFLLKNIWHSDCYYIMRETPKCYMVVTMKPRQAVALGNKPTVQDVLSLGLKEFRMNKAKCIDTLTPIDFEDLKEHAKRFVPA